MTGQQFERRHNGQHAQTRLDTFTDNIGPNEILVILVAHAFISLDDILQDLEQVSEELDVDEMGEFGDTFHSSR